MRKNLFKKITALALSVSMIVGATGIVSAATPHAANGANVAGSGKWSSFSVCTREDGGKWEDALNKVEVYDDNGVFLRYQTYLVDYATEGWVAAGANANLCQFYVKNTGWDGEYDPNGNLVGDNPWGLWAAFTGVPVELGRNYTVSFKIKSTLKAPAEEEGGEDITTKHISFKAYDPVSNGEPSVSFTDISGAKATTSGTLTLDYSDPKDMETGWETVTATIQIPATKQYYAADVVGFKFACGALLKTYPDEINMSGNIYIKDFKVLAGTQYKVTYTNGSKTSSTYVNAGAKASYVAMGKKNYTQTGFKTSTGAAYNFNSPVTKDLVLTATYKKTAKPARPTIKKITSKKRKVVVQLKKKVANANGYQIKYSNKKNMKKAKTKTTTKTKYTIKKLKSRKFVYVQVRAYTLDSLGNKVYGKYSKKKRAYVK